MSAGRTREERETGAEPLTQFGIPRGTATWKSLGDARRVREAPIVVVPIVRLEKRVRRADVGDAFPAQLLHELILMRSVVPLDPPLACG
jgi:hypothetical protein